MDTFKWKQYQSRTLYRKQIFQNNMLPHVSPWNLFCTLPTMRKEILFIFSYRTTDDSLLKTPFHVNQFITDFRNTLDRTSSTELNSTDSPTTGQAHIAYTISKSIGCIVSLFSDVFGFYLYVRVYHLHGSNIHKVYKSVVIQLKYPFYQ